MIDEEKLLLKEVLLTKFVVGQTTFEAHGITSLYVKDGDRMIRYDLPIKSIGIVELQEELKRFEPKPPVRLITVKPDSELGKQLDLASDTPVKVFDITDEEYRREVEEYQKDFTWRTILFALDVEFVDESGNVITDFVTKKEALQKSGITGHHIDIIFYDIQKLTSKREEKADFLSERGLG